MGGWAGCDSCSPPCPCLQTSAAVSRTTVLAFLGQLAPSELAPHFSILLRSLSPAFFHPLPDT